MQPKRRQKDRPRRSFFRPPPAAAAAGYFAPRRELLLSAVTKVAKSTGRNCVSALPQRATVGCDFPHLLADIAFHHRCRSKGLCVRSPARRLPRPLAVAEISPLPNYSPQIYHTPCPTGTPTFAALRRQRRDLIIAKTVQRTRSYSRTASAAAAQAVQAIPRTDNVPRRANSARSAPPNLHLPAPRQGTLRP